MFGLLINHGLLYTKSENSRQHVANMFSDHKITTSTSTHPGPGEAGDGLCETSKYEHQEDKRWVDNVTGLLVAWLCITLE